MTLSPGTQIGSYEILAPIGAGGMGEVYQATDNKLKRKVALKFLPLNLTRGETAKERFMQEAQAASSLDHPSICTIYDIGETEEGQLYLAMALYEGGTLKARLDRAPLKINEALEFTIQVALGLGKAHASGIVHRDIKPANLVFTADGQIKIVDFGLVKLLGETGLTEAGTTLGTVAYMSPEQVQGQEVDERTDIWSLGVVLYEMVTGQLPFKRGHQKAIAGAITDDAPAPVRSLRSGVPKELDRILRRALAKDRDYRYQTVSDFVSELRWLKKQSERSRLPTSRRAIAVSIVLALLAGVGLSMLVGRGTVERTLGFTNPTQITTALGVEDDPAWSPDGQTLAYSASSTGEIYAGNWDIWLVQLGGGPPVNRTAEHLGADRFPSWSPDGRQIAFWSDREGGGYFVMSALGGAPRKLSAVSSRGARAPGPLRSRDGISGGRPEWSPDGTELAVSGLTETLGSFVEIVSLSTGRPRQVPLPGRPDGRRFDLTWSPDGRHFAYVDAAGPSSQVTRLWVLHLDDKTAHPVTDGLTNDWASGWSSDGRNLYFVSSRGGTMDLWQQPMDSDGTPSGTPHRLTTGVGMRQAQLSPDGSKLAYSRGRRIANLWRLPILAGRTATWADAEQLTFDQALVEHFDVSGDGERLLVSSDRGGNPDIWMMPSSGGEMQQLTATPTPDWAPAWSPDGKEFAFYSFRSGNRDVWTMALDGGPARQITRNDATDWYPDWSPDGREIVFWSERSGNGDIWSIAATGGEAVQITRHPTDDIHPQWGSTGGWLMFTSNRDDHNRLWRVPVAGGTPEALTAGPARMGRLSSDGREVFFIGWAERAGEIWSVSVQDGFERQVTSFAGRQGTLGANALAVDSRYLYFSWEQDLGDLWVMDVVSETRD